MTSSVSGTTTLLVTIGGSSLMFLGGFCNVVVIWTILKSRNLYRCSINRTVLHLSFSSLLDLIINVPLTLIIINLNRFNIQPFDWICSAEILQQSLISTVQLFFISIIGIERLLSIINPYDRDSNLRRINVLIGIVWILGFIVAFLAWSFFPVNAVVYFCRKSSKYEDFYNNFLYVHQPIGLVVLFITILSYSGIVIRVFHVQSTKAKQLNHNRFFRQLSAPVTVGTAPAAGTSTTVNPFDIPLQREEFFFEKETPKLRLTSKLYGRRKKLQPIWKSKRNKNQSQREVTTSLPSIQINQPSSEESCTMSQIPVSPLSLQNPTSTTVLSPGAPCLSYIFSDDESVETNNPNNVIQQRKRRFSTSPGVYYDPNFLAPPIVNDPEIFIQNRTSTRRKYSSESLSRVDNESVFSFSSRGSVVSTNSSSFLSITKSPSPTRARRMEIITTFNSFIIVLVFIALWTPFPAATLYLDKSKMEWNFLSFCIGMVSSLTNPIMYGLSIKAFQKELKKLNEKRKRKNNVQRFKKANN